MDSFVLPHTCSLYTERAEHTLKWLVVEKVPCRSQFLALDHTQLSLLWVAFPLPLSRSVAIPVPGLNGVRGTMSGKDARVSRNENGWEPPQSVLSVGLCSALLLLTSAPLQLPRRCCAPELWSSRILAGHQLSSVSLKLWQEDQGVTFVLGTPKGRVFRGCCHVGRSRCALLP